MRLKFRRSELVGYAFIAPFMIAFCAMLIVPFAYAFYLSLFKDALIGGEVFAGLENYARALGDDRFWFGIINTLAYGLILIPTVVILSVVIGLILDSPFIRGATAFRLILFLPYTFPGVIAALMWGYLYGPNFGPITQAAQMAGVTPPPLLAEGWILFSMANITVWELLGYKTLIVYTALKSIPPELEEAAALDGSSHFQYARHVKVPLISAAILLNAIFSTIGALQLFNQPTILKALVPAVVTNNYTPNMYARHLAFVAQEYNYAGAVSFMLAIVIAGLSFSVIYAVSKQGVRR